MNPTLWNYLKKYFLVDLISVDNTKTTIDAILSEKVKEIRPLAVPGRSHKQKLLVYKIKNMESPSIKKLNNYKLIGAGKIGEVGEITEQAIMQKMEGRKLKKPLNVRVLRCDYNDEKYCIYSK